MLLLDASGLGANIGHRHIGTVVDDDGRGVDLGQDIADLAPIALGHLAAAHSSDIDLGLRREHAGCDFSGRHFQGEDGAGHLVPNRRRAAKVEPESGLTDTGTSRDDDHLATAETCGDAVEIGEARGDAVEFPTPLAERFELIDGGTDEIGNGREVVGALGAIDRHDVGLSSIDDIGDLTLASLAHLGNALTGFDQAPQHCLLVHDGRVVVDVGRDADAGNQRMQIRRTTDARYFALALQFCGHRDGVGRLAPSVQIVDRVEDQLMRRPVEVMTVQNVVGGIDRILAEQHGTQHALLGGNVLRRCESVPDVVGFGIGKLGAQRATTWTMDLTIEARTDTCIRRLWATSIIMWESRGAVWNTGGKCCGQTLCIPASNGSDLRKRQVGLWVKDSSGFVKTDVGPPRQGELGGPDVGHIAANCHDGRNNTQRHDGDIAEQATVDLSHHGITVVIRQ